MAKSKRRYTKKSRIHHLKKARLASRDKWIKSRFPEVWPIDKSAEMTSIFQENRNHERALILDVDGTIFEHFTGKRKHKKVSFRPHFKEFLSETQQFSDLFIFSSMDILRLKNLWKKYFVGIFRGLFDRRLLTRFKKNIEPLLVLSKDVLIIDDNLEQIHQRSAANFIAINQWKGDLNDSEFPRVLKEIRERWRIDEKQAEQTKI